MLLLGAEAERIRIAHQFDPLFAVNSSVVDPLPHQVEAVYRYLLPLPRIRFLLADDTGAGKTIMTGLLLKELLFRGVIEKVLIITPGGLTKQWKEDELQEKFGLYARLVNRASFDAEPGQFSHYKEGIFVVSIDFLARNEVCLKAAEEVQWDLVVVDEAHKLSAYEYGTKLDESERYNAIKSLVKKTDHLIFLTATPHRGRKDTFRRLLLLLDEDLFQKDEHVSDRVREQVVPYGVPGERKHVAVEIPNGRPQIDYHSKAEQWTPRGDVLRCVIGDGASQEGPIFYIDEEELTLQEFGRLLSTYAGWGMRIIFVPDDRLMEQPPIEIRDPVENH
jgi:superfamily II DNA helicase RecQ